MSTPETPPFQTFDILERPAKFQGCICENAIKKCAPDRPGDLPGGIRSPGLHGSNPSLHHPGRIGTADSTAQRLCSLDISQDNSLELVAELVKKCKALIFPTYYSVIFLILIWFVLAATLLLVLLVKWFAALHKRELSYRGGLRIALVAPAPALVLGALLELAGRSIPGIQHLLPVLLYLAMAAGCPPSTADEIHV